MIWFLHKFVPIGPNIVHYQKVSNKVYENTAKNDDETDSKSFKYLNAP